MARADYSKAQRDAWQATRLAGERARGSHSSGVNKIGLVNGHTREYWAASNAAHAAEVKARDAARGVGQINKARYNKETMDPIRPERKDCEGHQSTDRRDRQGQIGRINTTDRAQGSEA